jgi:hypothetical protein
MNITWKISAIDCDTATNRATTAHWRVKGTEGDLSGSTYGTASIAKYAENTPYEAINEAMAIAWTKAALGKNAVESAEKSIAQQIARQQTPDTTTGLPWS